MPDTDKKIAALETAVRLSRLAIDCLIRAAQGLEELPPSSCDREDQTRAKIARAVLSAHMKASIIEMTASHAQP